MSGRPSPRAAVGLVLDGGRGRRLGGLDKELVALGGRPMIAYAIEKLRPQVGLVAISAAGDPARFATFGLAVVADDPPGFMGPLAGVLAGLEYAKRAAPEATHVASLPCDAPFAPEDFVARLLAALGPNAEIAVAASGGRRHHAAALWPVTLAGDLRRALVEEGVRRIADFADGRPTAVVEWPTDAIDPFANVNTPEDLRRAEARLARG